MPRKDSTPEWLWHYTSPTAVLGILTHGVIRATMIHYLNDARELNYALDLAKDVIEEESDKGGAHESADLCREFLERIRNIAVYVASFSAQKDDLSQWRAYCPPGGGHALAFETAALQAAAQEEGFQLRRCRYRRDEQVALLRPIVQRMLNDEAARNAKDLYDQYAIEVAICAAQVKHEAFHAEDEWRLVAGPTRNGAPVSYRENGVLLIPFREIAMHGTKAHGIAEIMIGPHRHPELAARSLRTFTARGFGWPLRVSHSEAPFRSLS